MRETVGEIDIARGVYGTLTMGLMLAAESAGHETYPRVLTAAAVTLLAYWLAHAYSHALAQRLVAGGRVTLRSAGHALGHEAGILRGALVPTAVLIVCAAVGVGLSAAVTVALWSTVATLAGLELLAAQRSGASPRGIAVQTAVGTLLGLGVLAVKLVLH